MKTKQMIEEKPSKIVQFGYNDAGQEVLDSTPLSLPFDCKKPESLNDMIMRIVRAGRITDLEANDLETLEEADDFDCDDDEFPDPTSPHEEFFDPQGESLGFLEQNERDRARASKLDDSSAKSDEVVVKPTAKRSGKKTTSPAESDDSLESDE